jgi:hypothetical protein
MHKRAILAIAFVLVFTALCPVIPIAAQEARPAPQAATTPQAAPAPAAAQKPAPAPTLMGNVRIDVTIIDQAGTKTPAITKTMSIVVSRNGSLRSGVNVPLPSTTFASEKGSQPQGSPVTSYNYRNMGLSLDVAGLYLQPSGLIHVRMSLEYNPIDETDKAATPPGMPVSYSNFSQAFELDLENGKPLLVAQTSDPVPSHNRTLSVEVRATIVK